MIPIGLVTTFMWLIINTDTTPFIYIKFINYPILMQMDKFNFNNKS